MDLRIVIQVFELLNAINMWLLQELSDVDHNGDSHHNPDYDHEAFLGKEEAHEFDELSPEESKNKLGYAFSYLVTVFTFKSMVFNSLLSAICLVN